jgi:hypothetical protein
MLLVSGAIHGTAESIRTGDMDAQWDALCIFAGILQDGQLTSSSPTTTTAIILH